MIIWGGDDEITYFGDGARYNPTTDTWTPVSSVGAPFPRTGHTAVWTGAEMIVWGGTNGTQVFGDGARYNPASDTWSALTSFLAPSARTGHTAVWTGTEMIVWGGTDGDGTALSSGGRYGVVYTGPLPGNRGGHFPCSAEVVALDVGGLMLPVLPALALALLVIIARRR
jgi:hypothetical protein